MTTMSKPRKGPSPWQDALQVNQPKQERAPPGRKSGSFDLSRLFPRSSSGEPAESLSSPSSRPDIDETTKTKHWQGHCGGCVPDIDPQIILMSCGWGRGLQNAVYKINETRPNVCTRERKSEEEMVWRSMSWNHITCWVVLADVDGRLLKIPGS